jgi:hypothetical protein
MPTLRLLNAASNHARLHARSLEQDLVGLHCTARHRLDISPEKQALTPNSRKLRRQSMKKGMQSDEEFCF